MCCGRTVYDVHEVKESRQQEVRYFSIRRLLKNLSAIDKAEVQGPTPPSAAPNISPPKIQLEGTSTFSGKGKDVFYSSHLGIMSMYAT